MRASHAHAATRRLLAALASIWLVAGVVLASRHEAQVAHVVDARSGLVTHADRLVGAHTSDVSDIHGTSPAHQGEGECGICAALHQAARPVAHRAPVAIAPLRAVATVFSVRQVFSTRVLGYRLAPKTSPPAAV
jgi:hypothetical protein